jgi:hypothetical protein
MFLSMIRLIVIKLANVNHQHEQVAKMKKKLLRASLTTQSFNCDKKKINKKKSENFQYN